MIDPMLNGDAVPEAQQQAKNGSSGCEPFFEDQEAAMSIEVRGNLPGLQQDIGNKFKYNVVPMPSITAANGKQVNPDRWRQPRLGPRPRIHCTTPLPWRSCSTCSPQRDRPWARRLSASCRR